MAYRSFITQCLCVLFVTCMIAPSFADMTIKKTDITAPAAQQALIAHQRLLIDVRTPAEWQQTGVAAGALPVTMNQPDGKAGFIRAVLAAAGGNKNQPIAVICRTGNRSALVQQVLIEEGFTDVANVAEGMAGSSAGPGWLQRGLPLEWPQN